MGDTLILTELTWVIWRQYSYSAKVEWPSLCNPVASLLSTYPIHFCPFLQYTQQNKNNLSQSKKQTFLKLRFPSLDNEITVQNLKLWYFWKHVFKYLGFRVAWTIVIFVYWNVAKGAPLHSTQMLKYLSACTEFKLRENPCEEDSMGDVDHDGCSYQPHKRDGMRVGMVQGFCVDPNSPLD